MKDSTFFREQMLLLCEIHNRAISDTLMDTYWKVFEPFSDEEVGAAIKAVILEKTFFPKPAEFIEILQGTKKDRGFLAWMSVVEALKKRSPYDSIRFEDPVINDVLSTMGTGETPGWPAICMWSNADLVWKEKEFVQLYEIMAGRPTKVAYLPGLHEQTGGRHGEPVLIPLEGKRQNQLTWKGEQDGKSVTGQG